VIFILLASAILLLVDVLFSIVHFEYTYFLELKRRFSITERKLHDELRNQIKYEVFNELGQTRRLIQIIYIPWYVLCFFYNLWYLPVSITIVMFFTNLFYKSSYISPIALLLNMFGMFLCFLITILSLILF